MSTDTTTTAVVESVAGLELAPNGTLQHGFRVTNAEQVRAMMRPHPDAADGSLLDVPNTKRAARLTEEEFTDLREWAAENVRYGVVVMDDVVADALLGLVPIDPKQEPPFWKQDGTYYAARNNLHNRRLVAARVGDGTKAGYAHDMRLGLWGFADPLTIHADGVIASAQHRALAYKRAKQANPELGPIEFPVLLYVPVQFGDLLDKGKQRDGKDAEFRDVTAFTPELVDSIVAEYDNVDLPKLREKWSKTLVTASNNIFARCNGVNVHPSKAQQPSDRDRLGIQERFENDTDLQELVLRVWVKSRTPDDKPASWSKVWSEALVVTAIVLRCNDSHDNAESLTLDIGYATDLLNALAESSGENASGPFGPAMADVLKTKAGIKAVGGASPSQQELFGALVTAIGQWDNEKQTGKVWPGKRDRKKSLKDGVAFVVFGGVDKGQTVNE